MPALVNEAWFASLKMIKISFPPQKHDYVLIPGLVYRRRKQIMIRFLVDTGASVTMVAPDLMQDIGYFENCEEYVEPATVSGPAGKENGYKVKAQKILVHSMECVLPDIDIVCIRPEKNVEALLGLNFLKYFHYCIDHKNHVLTLQRL